jgi:hypothetical protein
MKRERPSRPLATIAPKSGGPRIQQTSSRDSAAGRPSFPDPRAIERRSLRNDWPTKKEAVPVLHGCRGQLRSMLKMASPELPLKRDHYSFVNYVNEIYDSTRWYMENI